MYRRVSKIIKNYVQNVIICAFKMTVQLIEQKIS
jgi:hypothetical protein